ncbi:MAG: CotH kinase family protein [Bacteroidetes bacterium]|nr:CotH kinase family protein [Bacteroidota bacterium]
MSFRNHMNLRWASAVLALGLGLELQAQVVINEFSCSNYTLGVGGDNEDFVEFYNPTGADVDLGGYFLSDVPTNLDKFEIPAGTVVPAGGHLLVMCSGEGELPTNLYVGGFLNTNFKINQCQNESLVFCDPGLNVLESYTFGADVHTTQADHSWCRTTDGAATWSVCLAPTPQAANGADMVDGYAPAPTFNAEAGHYDAAVSVELSVPAGYEIRYTLDGYTPTAASPLYTGPFNVGTTTVVRAVALDPTGNLAPSFIQTNTFFIGADNHTIPVVSVSGNGQEDGQWGWGNGELAHIEFFHADGTFWVEATGDSNEHGNDSNAYGQRGFDYITRDQMGYDYALEAELFHVKERDQYQRLIFKAAANDNYPFEPGAHIRDAYIHTLSHLADLHLDERTNESCIVYLNGQYWGVYEYREKVDDLDFTEEYYDQPRHFVDFLKTWGGTWEEYGTGGDWYDLVTFCTTQDMTVPANYEYAVSQLNPMSLIDYFVLNSYVVTMDWLNWNTAWWRGRHPDGDAKRWRYALWDNDASFGHYINYTGIPDTGPTADPCNPEGMGNVGGQGHIPVLNALLGNETFWNTYINRWADLGNTWFTCETMNAVLDSMVLVLEPEMPRQCQRWGGTVAGWETELQQMRDFIDSRCQDELLGGMEDCYDVTPVTLTLDIVGQGDIHINSLDITPDMTPYSGWYFMEVPITLEAEENYGLSFLYWEVVAGDVTISDVNDPLLELDLTGDVHLVAHFGIPVPPEEVSFSVSPPGSGFVILDGVTLLDNPHVDLINVGNHNLLAEPNEWWAFSHWTWTGNVIAPDAEASPAQLEVFEPGTVTAHFVEIPHTDLTVVVSPQQAGKVRVVDMAMVEDVWSTSFEPDGPTVFEAISEEEWQFSHWEVAVTEPLPEEKANPMALLLADVPVEIVTAHFEPVEFHLYVPNAFTPDNDGVNDAFQPLGSGFEGDLYHFSVFNRWGELVFQTDDPEEPWIGQNNQRLGTHFVPDGVYGWRVEAQGYHELIPTDLRGTVTVVR